MPDRDVKTIPPTTTFGGRQDLIYYQYAKIIVGPLFLAPGLRHAGAGKMTQSVNLRFKI
jgi:hypothetical protein